MMASHAMGWAGVVAMNIAPALRNKYYIGFSAAMLVFGLHQSFYVAQRRYNEVAIAYTNIRAVLREYRKSPQIGLKVEDEKYPTI